LSVWSDELKGSVAEYMIDYSLIAVFGMMRADHGPRHPGAIEGKCLNGMKTWRRLFGAASMVLVALVCYCIVGTGEVRAAQTESTAAAPRFEVASVRPSAGVTRGERSWGDGTGRVILRNIPLKYVLMHVFELQAYQLSGPEWLGNKFFDIMAVAPDGTTREQLSLMFEALLKERFKLRFHRENAMVPAYALVLGEDGPKLRKPSPNPNVGSPVDKKYGLVNRSRPGEAISGTDTGEFGEFNLTVANGVAHHEFASMTMNALAKYLNQGQLDLPVIDMTGLTGVYRIVLDTPLDSIPSNGASVAEGDASQGVGGSADPLGTSLKASLEKQGLKLVRRQAPIDKFVIDGIEKSPGEN
jgi:uncharacterized protein (TIGR03435 family)